MNIELILASVILLLMGALLIGAVYAKLQNRKLIIRAAQADTDRLAVYLETQEIFKRESAKIENKDGFVKFMAQSRDWAFDYIEQVQKDIYNLKDVHGSMGGTPKTVAHTNALREAILKVLENLPQEEKK